jgi:AcrR family transcriptional regulator
MMSGEDSTTRRLILEAVVTCIEQDGIDHLTTRAIAQQAGTNIASINYHFRSKDELLAEALTMTSEHMLEDVIAAIEDRSISLPQALADVFFYLIDGGRRFPGITTAHLYKAVVEKQYDAPGARAIRKAFDRLVDRAVDDLPDRDPAAVRFAMSQVLASIMFGMLAPNFFKVDRRYQPLDPKRCRTLAETCTGLFFAALPDR